MATPILIHCAGGNRRYAEIALEEGLLYGCRSDHKPLFPVIFADVNWKTPNMQLHMSFVEKHRPVLAVAPDILDISNLTTILKYAEQLAKYARFVIIVPKIPNIIQGLPKEPWLVIGYSVPTSYGTAGELMLWEIGNRPVHLLGGSPIKQLALAGYLNVISLDGNAIQKAARFGTWFDATTCKWRSKRDGVDRGPDMPYRAFQLSCKNIVKVWGGNLNGYGRKN